MLSSANPQSAVMRVLIVEDEVKMASLIRRGLRDDGMAADVAVKGQDALWMAGSTEYDVIVLDVMLPGMDGFQVCERLREDGVWSCSCSPRATRSTIACGAWTRVPTTI